MNTTAMPTSQTISPSGPPVSSRVVFMPLRLGEITLLNLRFEAAVLNEPLEQAIAQRVHDNTMIASMVGAHEGVQIKGAWNPQPHVELSAEGPWLRYQYSSYPRYYIDLRGDYAAYLKKFSSKSQYNLRRQRRVYFEKLGMEPGMVSASTPEEVEDFFRRARKVSELTYQERLLGSGLPQRAEFIEQMRLAAREGRVRGFLLPGPNGRDAAYMYCLAVGDDLVCKYIGYDPELSSLSPGSTLLLMAVESLCAQGDFRYFDFEEGGAQYKKQFATGETPCGNLLILHNTLTSRVKLRAHFLQGRLVQMLGSVADRLGLRAALRKLVRQRFSSN
jgi:CelD/BcsL family acetyltransferase involved in cellulose biosynthesis